jgi:sporulation protein YunB
MYLARRRKLLKVKILMVLALLFIMVTCVFIYIDREIMPTVQAIGELKAQELTTSAVNIGVSQVLDENIEYKDLVYIKEDGDGNITLLQANTMMMNRIASDVALNIQEQLKLIEAAPERIPLGNALQSQLLAQYGPKLRLTVTPVGVVDVNFGTEFQQSGINQTRHRIFLTVNTRVRVIVPLSSNTIEVVTYVPIAETVIVGQVPHSFIQVPEDKVLNVTPLIDQ